MNNDNGNLWIVLIGSALFMGAIYLINSFGNFAGASVEEAKINAAHYLKALQYEDPIIVCAEYDSNNNGYVSCTVRESKTSEPFNIECAGSYQLRAKGCRLPLINNIAR